VLREAETILADLAATGTKAAIPQILCGAAEVCIECDDREKAGQYIEAAFLFSKTTGQPHWDAELHRVKGELLFLQDPEAVDEVTGLLHRALEIAQGQKARSLELRAATALARLLRDQGRPDAAADALADCVGWFQEGLDTEDLVAARSLLGADAPAAD
jgi:predicted ATPase